MSFKIINPGYGKIYDADSLETIENSIYNPLNGIAFQKSTTLNNELFLKINLPEGLSNELYFKFDLFADTTGDITGLFFGDYRSDAIKNKNWMTALEVYWGKAYISYSNYRYGNGQTINAKALNKIWAHIHFGADNSTSYSELQINNNSLEKIFFSSNSYAGYYPFNNSYKEFIIYFPSTSYAGNYAKISNLIISDEYISPKEQIISLPISSIESDMTFDSETGIYTATAANQSLLSAVNVTSLIEEYGNNSTVTGVALVGNPAYKTAEGLSSLTAFSKDSSGNVANYGTYALGSDSSGVIADSQILTGKTISDLQNLKFGWIAN